MNIEIVFDKKSNLCNFILKHRSKTLAEGTAILKDKSKSNDDNSLIHRKIEKFKAVLQSEHRWEKTSFNDKGKIKYTFLLCKGKREIYLFGMFYETEKECETALKYLKKQLLKWKT